MNWQNMTFSRRLVLGIGLILALVLALGMGTCLALNNIGDSTTALAKLHTIILMVASGTFFVLIVGGITIFFMVKGTSGVLAEIAAGIEENAAQVAAAAGEIFSVSQLLSENASSQSATVEETTASLDEMSAMSKKTAELTAGSEILMNENIEKTGQSLKSLVELTRNMKEIESDSGNIRSIIDTIDAIAFQTNLLALNAAVEAARAGEAGAGFAVVADEVKNLANRAAQAAKNTQEMLDKNINKIGRSTTELMKVNSDFDSIVSTATGIGDKTTAITKASEHQSSGIEEITRSSMQLDQVAQQMSSTANNASAAAERLANQSEEMGVMVSSLMGLVYGANNTTTNIQAPKFAVTCWEIKNCPIDRRNNCPAYPDKGGQCWTVTSTLCGGQEQGSYRDKMAACRKCDVHQEAHHGATGQNGGVQLMAKPANKVDTVLCWEIKNCPEGRRNGCPAYPDNGSDCWMVTGTRCGGEEQGTYQDKMGNCRKCDTYIMAHTQGTPQIPDLRSAI